MRVADESLKKLRLALGYLKPVGRRSARGSPFRNLRLLAHDRWLLMRSSVRDGEGPTGITRLRKLPLGTSVFQGRPVEH